MRKITKRAFIADMTANDIIFFGVTKKLASSDELALAIDNFKNALENGAIVEHRHYTAHSNFLEATGGSRLYFDQKDTEYSFFQDLVNGRAVFICREKGIETEKNIYYIVA